MKDEYELYGKCPYVTVQKVLAGKWAVVIINNLKSETLRFGVLQRRMPGITQATLTKQLRLLEDHGLISRHVYAQVPPKVEYALSDIGRQFLPVLDQMEVFGKQYIDYLKTAEIGQTETEVEA